MTTRGADVRASQCDEDTNDDNDNDNDNGDMASAMAARCRRRQRQQGDGRMPASATTGIDARECDGDGTRQRDGDD